MGLVTEYLIMILIVLVWILLGSLKPVAPAAVTESVTISPNVSTTVAPKTIKEIEKELEAMVTYVSKLALPYFVRNSDLKLSGSCMSTFVKIFVDLRKLKLPAIKLLDAMAKPPYGLLHGTFSVMGDYDQCLEVSSTKRGDVPKHKKDEYYHGQYCTVEVELPPKILEAIKDYNNRKINLTEFGKLGSFIGEFPGTNFAGKYFKYGIGICLPSTCSLQDLKEILKLIPVNFLPMDAKRCDDGSRKPLNTDQMVFLVVLLLIAAFVVFGTILDAYFYLRIPHYSGSHKNKFLQIILAFSVYSNTKKLFRTEKNPHGDISVINGMYVVGTFLVVIYHTYFLPFFLLFSSHGSNLGHYLKDFDFTLIVNMGISIEAYFLFSGILLAYPRFRRQEKKVNIRIIKLIVRRYIRLCPSLLLILGIIVALPLLGSGPVYADIFEAAADNTRKWWWTYALMFNNFLPVKDQNFLYLWFIPCLMQITIVGALLLWLIAKCPKFGIFVTIAAGIICNIIIGVQTAVKHFPPTYSIYYYHDREYFEEPIYTAPLNHVLTYGIGLILGYYMAKHPVLKWSKKHVVFGWIVSLLLTIGVQLICYVWHDGLQPDPVAAAIYAATHRTAFTLGLSWIILACTHGYGGVLAKVLSWKGFVPLSKLGYFGYLIHYIVITHHVSMARVPLMYSHYEVWMRFCGYSFLTFLSAFVLYITFEQPLVSIESLFWLRRPEDPATQHNLPQNIRVSDLVVVKPSDNHTHGEHSVRPASNGSSLSRREVADEHSRL